MSSGFDEFLGKLDSKSTVSAKVSQMITDRGTLAYSRKLQTLNAEKNNTKKRALANRITRHFNSKNINPNLPSLTVDVKNHESSDITELQNCLVAKGYICTLVDDKLTISLS